MLLGRDDLTPKQVAKLLGCQVDTVYKWVQRGRISHIRLVGPKGRIFIPRSAVGEIIKVHEREEA